MSLIRPDVSSIADANRGAQKVEEEVDQLLKDIAKDRSQALRLKHLDLKELSPAVRSRLSVMLAEQLRGQIPAKLAQALNRGDADPALLTQLTTRLANSFSVDGRAANALTPEAARQNAADPNLPQQALRWAQFVQRPQNVSGGGIQGRAGSAAPKGEGTVLAELIAEKLAGKEGPGLRNPRLVQRALKELTPAQRNTLMNATFGKALAGKLLGLGINDPFMFVKAGALPGDRAALATALGISRGRLLGLLMRAELLKIGPGRNGELAIRPEFLSPLKEAGVAMMAALAAMRGLSVDDMRRLYKKMRHKAGGFRNAVKGGRVPVKRDLMHWATSAARKKSELLFADSEEFQGTMSRGDAQELVQAWYLEHLLWDCLEASRRELEQQRIHDEQQRERERQRREGDGDDEDAPEWVADEIVPGLDPDDARDDNLMCFWITDNDPAQPGALRRMYVCVDPDNGGIIPQYIDKDGDGAQ